LPLLPDLHDDVGRAFAGLGGHSGIRFDPERADELAQAALISTSDLPGAGWRIIEGDAPQVEGLEQVTDAACDDVKAFVADARKGIAGRAERALERPTFVTLFGVVITVEVTAYNDSKGRANLLRSGRFLEGIEGKLYSPSRWSSLCRRKAVHRVKRSTPDSCRRALALG